MPDRAERHPGVVHLLSLFAYDHLPLHLQEIAGPISVLAHEMADRLQDGPELVTGLRKLLEGKDCLVRQRNEDLPARPVQRFDDVKRVAEAAFEAGESYAAWSEGSLQGGIGYESFEQWWEQR